MKTFTCSLDKGAITSVYFILVLTLILGAVTVFVFRKSGDATATLISCALGPGILIIIAIAMYSLQPRSVTVDISGLTIDRKIKPVSIDFSEISSIHVVINGEMKGVIRTVGNGGVFGYTGLYYNKKFGSMTWYCSQHRNYIILQTNKSKKLVITPDDPDGLIREVRAQQPSLAID